MKKWITARVSLFLFLLAGLLLSNSRIVNAEESNSLTILDTSYYDSSNIQLELRNSTLVLNCIPKNFHNIDLWFMLYSENVGKEVFDAIYTPYEGMSILDLSGYEDGTYRLYLYYENKDSGDYRSYWWDAGAPTITKSDSVYLFTLGQYYDEIEEIHKTMATYPYALDYYRKPSFWIESDSDLIKKKAEEITEFAITDYDKTYLIYEWVISNISYDYDGLNGKTEIHSSALDVLGSKKGVCQGYADLVAALLRSVGVPSMVVGGNAGSPIDKSNCNHAWNMVFADGRWIFLDATWDSNNRYENGKFEINEPNKNRMWFDMSLEMIAYSHYIIDDIVEQLLVELLDEEVFDYIDITYGKVSKNPFPLEMEKIILPEGYDFEYKLSVGKDICSIDHKGIISFTGKEYNDEIELSVILKKGSTKEEIVTKEFYLNSDADLKSKTLSSISCNKGRSYNIDIPDLERLAANVKYKVSYQSSNAKVATVSKKGKVKAISKGKSTIIATVMVGTRIFIYKQVVNVKK